LKVTLRLRAAVAIILEGLNEKGYTYIPNIFFAILHPSFVSIFIYYRS